MIESFEHLMKAIDVIPWGSLILLFVMFTIAIILLRWHLMPRRKQDFDFSAYFKDEATDRASLGNLIVMFFALLSGWTVVQLVQRDKPVETLLLGVLSIFVANALVKRGIKAYTDTTDAGKPVEDSPSKTFAPPVSTMKRPTSTE